jgi:chromosome segregation ATPase
MNDMKVSLDSIIKRGVNAVPLEQLTVLAGDIEKLKFQLSLIGGIDEEVVREHKETKERYDFLTGQLTDLRKATGDLNTLIAELDELMKKTPSQCIQKNSQRF